MKLRIENFIISGTNRDLKVEQIGEYEAKTNGKKTGEMKTGVVDYWYPANLFEAYKGIREQLITKDSIDTVDKILNAIDSSTKLIRQSIGKQKLAGKIE